MHTLLSKDPRTNLTLNEVPVGQSAGSQPQLLLGRRPRRSLRETVVLRALGLVEGGVVLPILATSQVIGLKIKRRLTLRSQKSPGRLTGRLLSCSRSPRIWTSAGNGGLCLGSPCQHASMMPYLPAGGSNTTAEEGKRLSLKPSSGNQ